MEYVRTHSGGLASGDATARAHRAGTIRSLVAAGTLAYVLALCACGGAAAEADVAGSVAVSGGTGASSYAPSASSAAFPAAAPVVPAAASQSMPAVAPIVTAAASSAAPAEAASQPTMVVAAVPPSLAPPVSMPPAVASGGNQPAAPPVVTLPPPTTSVPTQAAPVMAGPRIDVSKYASVDPSNRYTTSRVQVIDPCGVPGATANCNPNGSFIAIQNLNDIGAFRESMPFAGMSNDDPIVFPGQPGRSHSHTFFGNMVNAFTTSANIRDSAWCASAGGKLNCTSVWIPTMVDTLDGTPVVPGGMNFYYKGSYAMAPAKGREIVTVPVGLHMISGNPANANPTGAVNTRYICYGPKGENPGWSGSLTEAVAKNTCLPGGYLTIEVHFPSCWDGINLDSPDHISHMADPQNGTCPATHPKQIPSMSVNAGYPITAVGQVTRWRLASDMYDSALPAGLSGHADYMMGWDPNPHPELWGDNRSITEMWTRYCLNEQRDCHNYLIGNNKNMLY